jgi:hypothetical protein
MINFSWTTKNYAILFTIFGKLSALTLQNNAVRRHVKVFKSISWA